MFDSVIFSVPTDGRAPSRCQAIAGMLMTRIMTLKYTGQGHGVSDGWRSARLQYLQCISTGDTTVLH